MLIGQSAATEPGVEHVFVLREPKEFEQLDGRLVVGFADADKAVLQVDRRGLALPRAVLHRNASVLLQADDLLHQRRQFFVTLRIDRGVIREPPDRNAMAPPELTADAPVADVAVPCLVSLRVTLRKERDVLLLRRCRVANALVLGEREQRLAGERLLRQAGISARAGGLAGVVLLPKPRVAVGDFRPGNRVAGAVAGERVGHGDIPLIAQVRLDRRVATVAVADGVLIRLHAFQQAVAA
ncbi:MAG: hypothetical protein QM754_15080 [Tepidisphaeraceae bacterium]